MSHIFLYGPPGTGKSTVGKILARNLKLPFIDLDRMIEINAGMSITQIMQERGESTFRELELSALKSVSDEKESVIALGGGALLNVENHEVAQKAGKVILLMAELDSLFDRLNEDPDSRPLLAGDLRTQLSSMLARRSDHYSSFALRVNVDGRSADENALEIQILLGRFHLSAMGEYDVIVEKLEQIGDLLLSRRSQAPILVTDENVAKLHAEKLVASLNKAGYRPKVVTFAAGEEHKNLDTVSFLWKSFLENNLDRKSTVIALGGGVIGDMAGFAASTYMRGIDWVSVPTTLLSMVDASLGGKTGFDLPEGKNLIGAFHPPRLVLADADLLTTLPNAEFISGLAEVVKHGIISDPELFTLCSRGLDEIKSNLEEMVRRAMAVKIKIIEEDPYEKGIRAALNLGHTVGHAVELVSKFELRHGEAVAIGMVVEARYAEKIGLSNKGLSKEIENVLCDLGLPVDIPKELQREEIIQAMRRDKKKNVNAIRFALPVEIGKVELVDVSDLEEVLE
ncbi:MAG TPA: 3-dehydroquinate synthase [Anaerolineales bacterium]|nr:3-dehydroquinate synthase [Anaerolineales bacterium]